jgi:putative transcriptional regulator
LNFADIGAKRSGAPGQRSRARPCVERIACRSTPGRAGALGSDAIRANAKEDASEKSDCGTAGGSYFRSVREFKSPSMTLAGSLLIAHPSLRDPNFCRTVLFLSTNDADDGSFGLTLNRPAGRTVADLLPNRDLGALACVPVFIGGPVATDQLIFASFQWRPEAERMECRHHLVIDEAEKALADQAATVRAFVGYAGWSKGQLEGELAQRSWLVQKPERHVLELERCPTLWREITSTFGPWFRLVAEAPDEPGKN